METAKATFGKPISEFPANANNPSSAITFPPTAAMHKKAPHLKSIMFGWRGKTFDFVEFNFKSGTSAQTALREVSLSHALASKDFDYNGGITPEQARHNKASTQGKVYWDGKQLITGTGLQGIKNSFFRTFSKDDNTDDYLLFGTSSSGY